MTVLAYDQPPSLTDVAAVGETWKSHPRASHCRGLWPLSEGGGLQTYDAGGRHTGVLTNIPNPSINWERSPRGPAVYCLKGNNEYISIPDFFPIADWPYTLSIWVSVDFDQGGGDWFSVSLGDQFVNNRYHALGMLGFAGTSFIGGRWDSSLARSGGAGPNLRGAGWHLMTGVFVSDTAKHLYINGAQVDTYTSVLPIGPMNCLNIAARASSAPTGGNQLSGRFGHVRIDQRILTDTEIYSLYTDPWREFREAQEGLLRRLWTGFSPGAQPALPIAFDAASDATMGATNSATWQHTCNGDCLIVTIAALDTNGRIGTGVTYNGQPLALVDRGAVGAVWAEQWYRAAPSQGTHDVVVSLDNAVSNGAVLGAVSLSNVDQAVTLGNKLSNAVTATSINVLLTGTSPGSWVVDSLVVQDDQPTADASQIERFKRERAPDEWGASSTKPSTGGNVLMEWSVVGANQMALVAGEYLPASVPPGQLIGQPVETDSAQALLSQATVFLAQALEADSAQTILTVVGQVIGQASEVDAAQTILPVVGQIIGQASESDTAQAIAPQAGLFINQVLEVDAAQVFTSSFARAVGQLIETDNAQSILAVAGVVLGQTLELDTAQTLQSLALRTIGQASELDTAQQLRSRYEAVLGQPVELDTPFAFQVIQPGNILLNQVLEADTAQSLIVPVSLPFGQAQESDLAQAFAARYARMLGQSSEVDIARGLVPLTLLALGRATELNVAQQLIAPFLASIGQSVETDSAEPIVVLLPGGGLLIVDSVTITPEVTARITVT